MMGAVSQPSGSHLALHRSGERPVDSCFFLRERYRDKEALHCKSLQIVADSDARECGAATAVKGASAFTIG